MFNLGHNHMYSATVTDGFEERGYNLIEIPNYTTALS
jgi:hypothetical protein